MNAIFFLGFKLGVALMAEVFNGGCIANES